MSKPPDVDRLQVQMLIAGHDGKTITQTGPSLIRTRDALEPGVVERFVSLPRDHCAAQVVTHYAPADRRPVSYPPDFPFIAGVEVFVTVYPNGQQPVGARWLCNDDCSSVVDQLIHQSVAEGWVAASARDPLVALMRNAPERFRLRAVHLSRANYHRSIIESAPDADAESSDLVGIVQLLDIERPRNLYSSTS